MQNRHIPAHHTHAPVLSFLHLVNIAWNSAQLTLLSQSSSTSQIISSMSACSAEQNKNGEAPRHAAYTAAVGQTFLHLWLSCLKTVSSSSASILPSLNKIMRTSCGIISETWLPVMHAFTNCTLMQASEEIHTPCSQDAQTPAADLRPRFYGRTAPAGVQVKQSLPHFQAERNF